MSEEPPPTYYPFQRAIENGRRGVVVLGQERAVFTDLYHRVLTMPIWGLLLLVAAVYLTINVIFAGLYMLSPGSISNARAGSFLDAFFFSVQTLSTVGFGDKAPRGLYANILVTLEAFVAIINVAVTTGLIFARVSRPTARVLFSQVAIVTLFNGVPTLMFRAANKRGNQVLEAQVTVNLARQVVTDEGHTMRAFFDLPVVRARSPLFLLSWTVMHQITESSPLYGLTVEQLRELAVEIIVVLSGVDETFAQRIHTRHAYTADQILWDKQFVDILSITPDGHRSIDYRKFHEVRDIVLVNMDTSDAAAD